MRAMTTRIVHRVRLFAGISILPRYADSSVKSTYETLISQSKYAAPPACNFALQALAPKAAKDPDQLAVRCLDQDTGNLTELTYAELLKQSEQVAQFLVRHGIKKGETIGLMLGQQLPWWPSLAAAVTEGLVVVPLSKLLTTKDLAYRIQFANMRVMITTPELQDRVDEIRAQCPSLKITITTGAAQKQWYSFEQMISEKSFLSMPSSKITTTTKDRCLLFFTSGTTGFPKAVVLNQGYPFVHWSTATRWLGATPDDLVYNPSDTGWGFAVWMTSAVWSIGAKLLVTPTNQKFDPQKMLKILSEQPVTIFCAAPTVLRALAAHPDFDRYAFSDLKRIVTAGEALDETIIQKFQARGIELRTGYGQSETPPLIGDVDGHPHIPGMMGKAIPPHEIVILDEHFKTLPPGETGQIAVDMHAGNSHGFMEGYLDDPEKTKAVYSPDGRYFLTGDFGQTVQLADGSLAFVYEGRRDDQIKSSGYRISPSEVEAAGMSHPAVAKIAVIGISENLKDPTVITIKACVLLKAGYVPNEALIQAIQAQIKQETAAYKYPRIIEFFTLEAWSAYETISGKIRRAALRARDKEQRVERALKEHGLLHSAIAEVSAVSIRVSEKLPLPVTAASLSIVLKPEFSEDPALLQEIHDHFKAGGLLDCPLSVEYLPQETLGCAARRF